MRTQLQAISLRIQVCWFLEEEWRELMVWIDCADKRADDAGDEGRNWCLG